MNGRFPGTLKGKLLNEDKTADWERTLKESTVILNLYHQKRMKRRELPYHENIIQDLRHRLNNKLGAFFPKYRCHWELHPLASLCIILLATATERTNCQTPTFDRRSFSLDFSSERQHSWRNACHALKELMWPRDWCWMKAFHSECGDNFSQFRNGRGSTLVTYPRTIDLRTESRFIQLGLDLCQANHLNPILHLLDMFVVNKISSQAN